MQPGIGDKETIRKRRGIARNRHGVAGKRRSGETE
jgi:hypothetical protein